MVQPGRKIRARYRRAPDVAEALRFCGPAN